MRRLQLFEFEDQHWFPGWLRNLLTETLQFGTLASRRYDSAEPLIADLLQRTGTTSVVDLCSGSTGPWFSLAPALCSRFPGLRVTLTDRYPNPEALQRGAEGANDCLRYEPDPVEADSLPSRLTGARTLFTSFHHFPEARARAILGSAVDDRVPIAIFEYTERTMRNLILAPLITPLLIAIATPFMRPLTLARLFWTYLVPAVPLITAWDGTVSHLRTYTPAELGAMTASLPGEAYAWRIGQVESERRRSRVTYVLGWPVPAAT